MRQLIQYVYIRQDILNIILTIFFPFKTLTYLVKQNISFEDLGIYADLQIDVLLDV